MLPTMFKLVRTTASLVSSMISIGILDFLFLHMALVGLVRLWLAQSTRGSFPLPARYRS